MNNHIVSTIVVTVACVALMVGYLVSRRSWRTLARQKLERAAGGKMSPTALAAFDRRDRRSDPWKSGGIILGLATVPIIQILGYPLSATWFCMIIPVVFGSALGNIAAAMTPLSGPPLQRRLASLTPRTLEHYVSPGELRAQHIALGMPAVAILVGIMALFDRANPTIVGLTLVIIGLAGLAFGIVAPHLRRRLLEVPNPADTVEISFWNNAIVSRAICDLTEAVSTFAILCGCIAGGALLGNPETGSLIIDALPLAGLLAIVGVLVALTVATLGNVVAGGRNSFVPTFIRLHQPGMGRHA